VWSFSLRPLCFVATVLAVLYTPLAGQGPNGRISDIRYDLTFDAGQARERLLRAGMTFQVRDGDPVLLSLPAWTPGAYEISNFARHVRGFSVSQNGRPLRWDKTDYDTWRLRPAGPGEIRVEFRFLADSLDNAMAWARADFLLVNGTNVFLYPEGQGFDFPAAVTVRTEPGWVVMTGMTPGGAPNTFRTANYHDLVDMPFFVGRLDVDSVVVDGRSYRVASWPSGAFRGAARQLFLTQLRGVMPAMSRVFGETPWTAYTTLLVFDSSSGGGSALEHQNSHVGIYNPGFIGTPILASITAHEIFHAWNVKRLRPAQLVPYRYDVPQPTEWLWVSEGITDYYADIALVRGGVVDSAGFLELLTEKLETTDAAPPTALEDASLSTWIHPTDGSEYLYYSKGALAGFLLDILIRDASDNQRSLDDVLRTLYQRTWKAGRGFTPEDWWGTVREAAGGRDFGAFASRYIDGAEAFPWAEVLPLAGLRLAADTIREPRIGVTTSNGPDGALVVEVVPGSSADAAGVQPGDFLLRVGEIDAADQGFGFAFRARYGREPEGSPYEIVVRRGESETKLNARLRFEQRVVRQFAVEPRAGLKAARIRNGIFGGR
jgi:predicted metalloprotease with PDZ domain